MKILITGTRGFLGGRIASFLNKKSGFNLVSLSRNKKFDLKKKDSKTKKNLKKLFKGVDVVINCIGYDMNKSINKSETNFVNSSIPSLIYNISNKAGVKYFFYISTYHIYDFTKKINENSNIIPKNLYTRSKILGEKKVLKNIKKTKLVILRLCNLFGYPVYPNKNSNKLLLNYIISRIAQKKTIKIKSKYDEYRHYSSMETFNFYLHKVLKNLKKIKLDKGYVIYNYFTDKCFRISQLENLFKKKEILGKKHKVVFKFKHKKLKKGKKIFISSFDKLFLPQRDYKFANEIKKTFNYYKNLK